MKKLTRMKLINWHRFENCTVDFDGSTLISGENGAGKSTLLDAIQYVIICSANSFNKAAHENGKRKLTGYIRCKSGRENKPYERSGEISAHIALEFYEESRDAYFIIGAVIDSASEGQETTVRYLINDARLTDEMFFQGRAPRSIVQFRAANKNIRHWCKTQAEARKVIKSRLGRLEDKFFKLIPKALAFKPIDDIKDFVYSYVLDEKEVDIASLQQNVRTYQELELTLDSIRKRIEKLEHIKEHHTEAEDCDRRDRMYAYFLTRADADIAQEQMTAREANLLADQYRMEADLKEKEAMISERERTQEMETNLRVELRQNSDFLALEEQKKQMELLQTEEQACREELRVLKGSVRKALAQAEKLLKLQTDADQPFYDCLRKFRSSFARPEKITDVAAAKELLGEVIAGKKKLNAQLQQEIAGVRIRLYEKQEEQQKLKQRIAGLEKKKLSWPDSVERLLGAIREEFARLDRTAQPHVLCELLEITDESWRNAVEGYLNTQRFYILVEPGNFDIALGIYDRLRRQGKAYGAGLINAADMKEYDTAPPDSLASVVESKNRYARRYINMVLGKVHLCERYEDLKKYPVSITKECMRYQNRVASAIRPEIFQVPFIGKQAFKVQLAQARQQEKQLKEEIAELKSRLKQLDDRTGALSLEADLDVKFRLDVLTRLSSAQKAIRQCAENIKTLQRNATLIEKQIQLDQLESMRRSMDKEIEAKLTQIGETKHAIETGKSEIERLKGEIAERISAVEELAAQAEDELPHWEKEYDRQTSDKTPDRFKENYERQRKANATSRQKALDRMTEWMSRYKMEHDFGAAPTMEGYREFEAIYIRLKTSELLTYEEKVQSARASAEEEFQEQFLAKLQENIKQAQSEFRQLNQALKDITFSSERYEFLDLPSKYNREFYDMIMDDFNIVQGSSLFSGPFLEKHKASIEELFDRLAVSSENNEKALQEYTDYRNYMDYDIRIIHSDGSYSYYSKVCEEKSGGETQTPFYVTVAASFVQLYGRSIGGEAAGLVLFDEAFNNMDDERIGGVLEFFNRLPLQMIISAPPEKIQYIAPAMDETLLIMTDEKVSYVEEYYNARH